MNTPTIPRSPLLQKAFAKVIVLPRREQETLATILLEEVFTEERWAASFANSQDALELLADEAIVEQKAKKTKPLRA